VQELIKRLQDRYVECDQTVTKKADADTQSVTTVNPDTPNVLQSMMKFDQTKAPAKTANKVALEAEKENDAAEKAVEELKRQLQPKRSHTTSHILLTEFDNCDLSDHRREGTHVQNHHGNLSTILNSSY
jgi:hypothetical protein